MTYFIKVNNSFIKTDINFLKKFKSNNIVMEFIGSGTHIQYFALTDYPEFIKMHVKNFCKIAPTEILYTTLSGHGFLGAHIDRGPLVSLNLYINAELDETIFFEKKENTNKKHDEQESNIYNLKDLKIKNTFIANTQDTYLLNVNKIHAVNKKTNTVREFISYQWYNNTYQEVKENLIF